MDDPLEETKFDIKERTLKEFGSLMSRFVNVLLFNVFVAQSMLMCENLSVQDWFNLSFTDQVFPVFQMERVM